MKHTINRGDVSYRKNVGPNITSINKFELPIIQRYRA